MVSIGGVFAGANLVVVNNFLGGGPVSEAALTGSASGLYPFSEACPSLFSPFFCTSSTSSVTYSAEAQQFFDRLLTLPTEARATLIAACIDTLVASGAWDRLDILKIFAAYDQGTAAENWKSVSFRSTALGGGSVDFTQDRGFKADGGLAKLYEVYFPATSAVQYAQNDAFVASWVLDNLSANSYIVDTNPQTNVFISPRWSTNLAFFRTNQNTGGQVAATDSRGFWLSERTGANAQTFWRNDTLLITETLASSALTSSQIVSVAGASAGGRRAAAFVLGRALTAAQKTSLYSALSTYLAGVGAI